MTQPLVDFVGTYYFWGLLGFSTGYALILYDVAKNGISVPLVILVWTLACYGGLVGARVLFVLATDAGFIVRDPVRALAFWQGGLAWEGGVVLAVVVALVAFRCLGKPAWSNVGCFAPGLAVSEGIGRFGCLTTGCCYGTPTTLPWAIYSGDLGTMVHPTPAYTTATDLLIAILLQMMWRNPAHRKYLMPVYGVLMSASRFFLEFLRGEPPGPTLIPGLRFYQSTSLLLLLISALLFLFIRREQSLFPGLPDKRPASD